MHHCTSWASLSFPNQNNVFVITFKVSINIYCLQLWVLPPGSQLVGADVIWYEDMKFILAMRSMSTHTERYFAPANGERLSYNDGSHDVYRQHSDKSFVLVMGIPPLSSESDHLAQLDNKDQNLMWSVELWKVSDAWNVLHCWNGCFPGVFFCLDRTRLDSNQM